MCFGQKMMRRLEQSRAEERTNESTNIPNSRVHDTLFISFGDDNTEVECPWIFMFGGEVVNTERGQVI